METVQFNENIQKIHTGKFRWNLKMAPWKKRFFWKTGFFRFRMNFQRRVVDPVLLVWRTRTNDHHCIDSSLAVLFPSCSICRQASDYHEPFREQSASTLRIWQVSIHILQQIDLCFPSTEIHIHHLVCQSPRIEDKLPMACTKLRQSGLCFLRAPSYNARPKDPERTIAGSAKLRASSKLVTPSSLPRNCSKWEAPK